jgi:hypothetical protein
MIGPEFGPLAGFCLAIVQRRTRHRLAPETFSDDDHAPTVVRAVFVDGVGEPPRAVAWPPKSDRGGLSHARTERPEFVAFDGPTTERPISDLSILQDFRPRSRAWPALKIAVSEFESRSRR